MAEIQPIRALRYDLDRTGGLQDVVAPPYDVIDDAQRAALEARSPYNVVRIDLPQGGEDRYDRAAALLDGLARRRGGGLDEAPALWTLSQDYMGPDGRQRTRHGHFARVRVEEYGPGRIRPHERTHPGPARGSAAADPRHQGQPLPHLLAVLGSRRAPSPTRCAAPAAMTCGRRRQTTTAPSTAWAAWTTRARSPRCRRCSAGTELLIADGHHRYETARVYAEEIGGEGPHRYVLMCLVALQDPGLTVFPTHRLVRGLRPDQHETLANALRRDFDIEQLADTTRWRPPRPTRCASATSTRISSGPSC